MAGRAAVGIYVDAANIRMNGGYGMQYEVLREFACHDGAEPIRLNTYVAYDEQRAQKDSVYRTRTNNYFSTLRDYGFKVIVKVVKYYTDEDGSRFAKANADLDMAVDALLQSESLERVLLATGDGDFVQVVRALQNKGCRVEVLAFDNISSDLKREADVFISGFLVPGLLRMEDNTQPWGEIGSRVRGTCHHYDQERDFGFFRFLKDVSGNFWITDSRRPDSPYGSAFVHGTSLPEGTKHLLPSHEHIFEFDLTEGRNDETTGGQAMNVELVYPSR